MIVYHEANRSAVLSISKHGLKCTSRGEKGSDLSIVSTDKLLDEHRPHRLKEAGVSRDNNLYAYVTSGDRIVSITDGSTVNMDDFVRNSDQAIMKISVDPDRCFVSDLDAYDAVKDVLEDSADDDIVRGLAQYYWGKVIPLSKFSLGSLRRPEIMIAYDISPDCIELLKD